MLRTFFPTKGLSHCLHLTLLSSYDLMSFNSHHTFVLSLQPSNDICCVCSSIQASKSLSRFKAQSRLS